jgi:hypothetical protein
MATHLYITHGDAHTQVDQTSKCDNGVTAMSYIPRSERCRSMYISKRYGHDIMTISFSRSLPLFSSSSALHSLSLQGTHVMHGNA